MGPAACFDKSFLQSLSVDESVWFDQYFTSVITPLFFVETLADLEKEFISSTRNPEDEVRSIAEKTPQLSGNSTCFHRTLCLGELLGYPVQMSGRPVLQGSKTAVVEGKKGFYFGETPEAEALLRWQRKEFREIERGFARLWRAELAKANDVGSDFIIGYSKDADACTTLEDSLFLARSIVDSRSKPQTLLSFVFDFLNVSIERSEIFTRFKEAGFPLFREFAPYTGHVLDVELFRRIATTKSFIAKERPSNRVDIAYLNYLPFCQVFVSGDKLHQRTVPLFLNSKQDFVWGPVLKNDLKRINDLYVGLPEETKAKGILAFAPYPPLEGNFETSRLWDRMNSHWRKPEKPDLSGGRLPEEMLNRLKSLRATAKSFRDAPSNAAGFTLDQADIVMMERKMTVKRGSWYHLPKDLSP